MRSGRSREGTGAWGKECGFGYAGGSSIIGTIDDVDGGHVVTTVHVVAEELDLFLNFDPEDQVI